MDANTKDELIGQFYDSCLFHDKIVWSITSLDLSVNTYLKRRLLWNNIFAHCVSLPMCLLIGLIKEMTD